MTRPVLIALAAGGFLAGAVVSHLLPRGGSEATDDGETRDEDPAATWTPPRECDREDLEAAVDAGNTQP